MLRPERMEITCEECKQYLPGTRIFRSSFSRKVLLEKECPKCPKKLFYKLSSKNKKAIGYSRFCLDGEGFMIHLPKNGNISEQPFDLLNRIYLIGLYKNKLMRKKDAKR